MSEKIREWVEEKLDEGVEPERLERILEKNGHDPSIVEEVQSPFRDETDEKGDEEDFEFSFADRGDEEEDEETESGEDEGFSFPSFSMPSFSFPRPSVPSIPVSRLFSRKILGLVSVILLVLGGIVGFQHFEVDQRINRVLEPEPQCVGVKVYSVTSENGRTVADVRVVEEARVVLEVVENGETIGKNSQVMEGRGSITVNRIGDSISFHGVNCEDPVVRRNY